MKQICNHFWKDTFLLIYFETFLLIYFENSDTELSVKRKDLNNKQQQQQKNKSHPIQTFACAEKSIFF